MNKQYLLAGAGVLVAVVLATGGYMIGTRKGGAFDARGEFGQRMMQGAPQGVSQGGDAQQRMRGGMGVSGTVQSVDGTTLTVRTPNGSSRLVIIGSAKVLKTIDGALSDLASGSNVTVNGTQGTDGNFAADTIIIR